MCLNFVSLLYGNIKRYNVLQQNLFGVLSDSKSIDGVLKISVWELLLICHRPRKTSDETGAPRELEQGKLNIKITDRKEFPNVIKE